MGWKAHATWGGKCSWCAMRLGASGAAITAAEAETLSAGCRAVKDGCVTEGGRTLGIKVTAREEVRLRTTTWK